MPDKGVGYGLLRYLHKDAVVRDSLYMEDAAISFNYLGQFDQVLTADAGLSPAPESSGASFSASARRAHLIDITGAIEDGQLRVTWTYSQNVHRRETIDALATYYLMALRQLIAHCVAGDAGGFTSSDFKLADLNQRELDKVLRHVVPGKVGRSAIARDSKAQQQALQRKESTQ